jgi:hypothetical protein
MILISCELFVNLVDEKRILSLRSIPFHSIQIKSIRFDSPLINRNRADEFQTTVEIFIVSRFYYVPSIRPSNDSKPSASPISKRDHWIWFGVMEFVAFSTGMQRLRDVAIFVEMCENNSDRLI